MVCWKADGEWQDILQGPLSYKSASFGCTVQAGITNPSSDTADWLALERKTRTEVFEMNKKFRKSLGLIS